MNELSPAIPASGAEAPTHHLLPIGRWRTVVQLPGETKETEVIQEITREDIEAIAAELNKRRLDPNWPGLLLDVDHFSDFKDQSSEAAGWYKGPFTVEADGMHSPVELTTKGISLIEGKIFKQLSPTLLTNRRGETFHPISLESMALTNKPRFRELALVANRGDSIQLTPHQSEELMNEELLAALGLPADATAEQAVDVVKTLNRKVTDLETQNLERDADAFIAAHGDKFEDQDKARALFIQNRETAETLAGNLKVMTAAPVAKEPEPVEEPTKTLNRADTKPPVASPADEPDPEGKVEAQRAVKIRNRAMTLSESGMPWSNAWDKATREIETEEAVKG